jgi:hypothetical protein
MLVKLGKGDPVKLGDPTQKRKFLFKKNTKT